MLGGENSTYKGMEVRAHSQGMGHVPQLPVAREPLRKGKFATKDSLAVKEFPDGKSATTSRKPEHFED